MEPQDLAADAVPERVVAAVTANAAAAGAMPSHESPHGAHPGAVSVRTAEHDGHTIEIRTHYEIEVDGRPFLPHLILDNDGRVFYHGLPTRDFASLVDLVIKAIDSFPDDFPAEHPASPGHTHAPHGSEHSHADPSPEHAGEDSP